MALDCKIRDNLHYPFYKKVLYSLDDFLARFFSRKIDRQKIKRILVMRQDRVGDVAVSSHLFRLIKTGLPEVQLDVMVNPGCVDMVKYNPYVDDILECRLNWFGYQQNIDFFPRLLNFLGQFLVPDLFKMVGIFRRKKYELIIDCIGKRRNLLLALLGGAKYRIGYDFPGGSFLYTARVKRDFSSHCSYWLSSLLVPLGIPLSAPQLEIFLAKDHPMRNREFKEAKGLTENDRLIGLHPGYGGDLTRQWAKEKWIELIGSILAKNYKVLFFYGPQEENFVAEIISVYVDNPNFVIIKGDLEGMMEKLMLLDAFVCMDSGPMHIADALNVPLVALFAREDPVWWGPISTRHFRVIRKIEGPRCFKLNCPTRACIEAIEPQEVFENLQGLLQEISSIRKEA